MQSLKNKRNGIISSKSLQNLEFPQESPICDIARCLPENQDISYLNLLVIPSSPNRTIKKKIDFLNYNKNDEEDNDKWEVR